MRNWEGLVEGYLSRCRVRGLAAMTIKGRERELARFGLWISKRRPKPKLEGIDDDLMVRYLRDRTAFKAHRTVQGVVSILRGMGEFLVDEGVWRQNPLRWIRGPKVDPRHRLPRRIERRQLDAMWAAARDRLTVYARYQAVCVLALLYATGLRNGELTRLDVDDWDSDSAILTIDGRKTGQQRKVAVGKGVWRCIEAYLPHRHNKLERYGRLSEQALMVNRRGLRMTRHGIWTMLKRLADDAGVTRVTAHQFRHSCASDLLEAGVPLPEVKQMLGHSCIQSTVRYLSIADPQRAEAMKLHPLNQILASEQEKEAP